MPSSLRLILVVGALVVGFGASLYLVWRAVDRGEASSLSPGVPDWIAAVEELPDDGFERLSGPWRLGLPDDHGAHPEARTESWLLGIALRTAQGESIGVQLALLRVALVAPEAAKRESAWATPEVYRGHMLLASEATTTVAGQERFGRAALGLAGHDATARRVWFEDWSLSYGEGKRADKLKVQGTMGDTSVELIVTPKKPVVSADEEEGRPPFRGYAFTRLSAEGIVRRPSGEQAVSGRAWLDHVWGEVPLPTGPVVWDRLQLQLDDGSDVSIVRTRRRSGSGDPTLRGFHVDKQGQVNSLKANSITMTPDGFWQRKAGGIRYPVYWRLSSSELELKIEPLLEDQAYGFSVPIWSGMVLANGRSGNRPVSGTGTLALTGYTSP